MGATCLKQGEIVYKCSRCEKTKTEYAYADHAYDETSAWNYDKTENGKHSQTCKWCGTKICEEVHSFKVSELIKGDCQNVGTDKYECKCGYSFTKQSKGSHEYEIKNVTEPTCLKGKTEHRVCALCGDTVDVETEPKLDRHEYNANVCVYCDRDRLNDYIEEFRTKGNSGPNLIKLDCEEKFICLLDYVIAYDVNVSDGKHFQFSYDIGSDVQTYLLAMISKKTAASCSIGYGVFTQMGKTWYKVGVQTDGVLNDSTENSITCVDGVYEQKFLPEVDSAFYSDIDSDRTASFDDFKYLDRTYSMSVSDSNGLFYALSHGYSPLAVTGSAAEKTLNAAEDVLRRIADDGMSDVAKLWSIYRWFGKNVRYDYGAVNYTENKAEGTCYTLQAWYAEAVFENSSGICDAISKAFAIMANIEGITCVQVCGNSHAWNKVLVDANKDGVKEWYVIDPTYANLACGERELFTAAYFMITDAEKSKKDVATNCLDAVADTSFNVYKNVYYGTERNSSCDLYAANSAEVHNILNYYKSKYASVTSPMVLEFCVTSSLDENTVRNIAAIKFQKVSSATLSYFGDKVYLIMIEP